MTSERSIVRVAGPFVALFALLAPGSPAQEPAAATEAPAKTPPDARAAVERLRRCHLILRVIRADDQWADAAEGRKAGARGDAIASVHGERSLRERAGGSGEQPLEASAVLVGSDGLAATAASVLDGARRVIAEGPRGRLARCRILGFDRASGVGVVRVLAPLGTPIAVRAEPPPPGEPVVAVGNPFGLGASAAVGWVAAVARDWPDDGTANIAPRGLLQLQLAVHPGDQGAPVGDLEGRWVGMLLTGWGAGGGTSGGSVAFAVPAPRVVEVAQTLAELSRAWDDGGADRPRRVWLGIRARELDDEIVRRALGLDEGAVLVEWVFAGSPADRAGLQARDVLIAVDGEPLRGLQHLRRLLRERHGGDEVSLRLMRAGRPLEVRVVLEGP